MNKTDLNKKALASLLRLRYNVSPDTLYTNIKKLPPGHFHVLDLSSKYPTSNTKYFAGKLPDINTSNRKVLIKQYGIELEKAVNRQLLSDVEIGVMLSGGIDSALVAALAKKHYKGRLKAFTIGFEGDFAEDEIEDARETEEF